MQQIGFEPELPKVVCNRLPNLLRYEDFIFICRIDQYINDRLIFMKSQFIDLSKFEGAHEGGRTVYFPVFSLFRVFENQLFCKNSILIDVHKREMC